MMDRHLTKAACKGNAGPTRGAHIAHHQAANSFCTHRAGEPGIQQCIAVRCHIRKDHSTAGKKNHNYRLTKSVQSDQFSHLCIRQPGSCLAAALTGFKLIFTTRIEDHIRFFCRSQSDPIFPPECSQKGFRGIPVTIQGPTSEDFMAVCHIAG